MAAGGGRDSGKGEEAVDPNHLQGWMNWLLLHLELMLMLLKLHQGPYMREKGERQRREKEKVKKALEQRTLNGSPSIRQ